MMRIAPRDFALLILVTLLWGFNLVSSKVGLEYLPPFLFTALRFALVALLLLPFLRIRRGQMA
ncbi:MAG TPA: EamA family transporter, partial [Steroidobacteraceae bacterium]